MQVLSGCGHSVHEDAPDKVLTHSLFFCYVMLCMQVAEVINQWVFDKIQVCKTNINKELVIVTIIDVTNI